MALFYLKGVSKVLRNYRIPNEISTELKINKMLYLFDLIFIIGLIIFRQIIIPFVHSSLIWYFTIFLIIFGFFMIVRPSTNPQTRMYQAVLYALVRKKDSYSSIDYSISEVDEDGDN